MGIGKSKVSPSIDVDDMLGAVEAERQIASEKEELEKALKELRELKSVLQMFMEDLETAIGAECKAEGALKAAADSCGNVVGSICKAIVDAEQNTVFRAEISPECIAQLRQLLEDCIAKERQLLEEHRAMQLRMLEEHEVKLEKILSHGEGVWFSDFWMKFLCVFLLVYTVVIALLAYLGK